MDTFILNMGCRAAGVLLNTEHENRAEKESRGAGSPLAAAPQQLPAP